MPFHSSISISPTITAYFWKNSETLEDLFNQVLLKDSSIKRLESMQSIEHKKGFLGVRMLVQHIGFTDFDLVYDATGKPHLETNNTITSTKIKHISISHSHEFSSICVSTDAIIGVDLEKIKEKVLRIAPRFMDVTHLEDLSIEKQTKKATVIWGVKEAIFKIKNEVGISFPDHISEDSFTLEDKSGSAHLHFNSIHESFSFQFYEIESFIFVCAKPK